MNARLFVFIDNLVMLWYNCCHILQNNFKEYFMIKAFYEDKFIFVGEKPVGVLSEYVTATKNMPELLKKQTRAYKIDTIHRLDRNVGGVMVYSKNSKATVKLAKMMANHSFVKEYLAVVCGSLEEKQGTFEDFLVKDKRNCKVYVTNKNNPDAKYAKLDYEVLSENKKFSLVKVRLFTGRTHQIRVQFASRGFSLVGDTKYGRQDTNEKGKTPISLWSYHLKFKHPLFEKEVEAYSLPKKEGGFSFFHEKIKQLNVENHTII